MSYEGHAPTVLINGVEVDVKTPPPKPEEDAILNDTEGD